MADKPSPTQEPRKDDFPLYHTARIHDNDDDEIPAYAREMYCIAQDHICHSRN